MSAGSNLLLDRVRAATEDEYTIEGELGRGGMAAVFLARDIALDRRVAIKVMLPDLANVAGFQDRFVIEARTAGHLDHPGIVTVYSVRQRGDLTFIVMKYIEGRTLDYVLAARGALDPSVVATIGSRVAEALHFAHSHGVVHRDVKPSNIIIDLHGRPVVTDFGIAKVTTSPSLTVAGSTLGTPTYMSPEQCRGLPATAASDQYSLGVMLYELVTGRAPFTGNLFELLGAHASDAPAPIRDSNPNIDPVLEATISRMLAKEAADRLPSLGDVAKALAARAPRRSHAAELQAIIDAILPPSERHELNTTIPDIANATTEEMPSPHPIAFPGEFTRAFGAPTWPPVPSAPAVVPSAPAPAPALVPTPSLAVTEPAALNPGTVVVEAPRQAIEPPVVAVSERERSPMGKRALFAGIAVLLLAAAGYAIVANSDRGSPASGQPQVLAPKTDSVPAAKTEPMPVAATPDSTRVAAKPDSVSSTKTDSSPKTVVAPPPVAAPPRNGPAQKAEKSKAEPVPDARAKARADSIATRCEEINRKLGIGADVSRTDSLFLRRECARQRP